VAGALLGLLAVAELIAQGGSSDTSGNRELALLLLGLATTLPLGLLWGQPAAAAVAVSAPAALDPGAELAAYRIVQEALTNSRRHAPGAAVDVELHYAGDALRLRIRDNGPGPPPARQAGGHGLLGMRERAAAVGGELRSGPASGGGFLVEASLPGRGALVEGSVPGRGADLPAIGDGQPAGRAVLAGAEASLPGAGDGLPGHRTGWPGREDDPTEREVGVAGAEAVG